MTTTQDSPITVIPREQAVFWMDGQGIFHNAHGPFEHPKIIQYFNRSIQWDKQGFFLRQDMPDGVEKVYFPYEDTAFFVVDVNGHDPRNLTLNTGTRITLDPAALFIKEDSLFIRMPEYLIKFTPRALLKLSRHMTEHDGTLFLTLPSGTHPIS